MSSESSEIQATVIARELPMVTWEATGDLNVDGALGRMAGLGSMTLAEQAEVFDGIHRSLRDRLSHAAPADPAPHSAQNSDATAT